MPTLAVVGIPRVRGASLCFTQPELLPVSRGNDALVKVWGDTQARRARVLDRARARAHRGTYLVRLQGLHALPFWHVRDDPELRACVSAGLGGILPSTC